MRRMYISLFSTITILVLAATSSVADEGSADAASLEGLKWRMIGPYRDGRVATVLGDLFQLLFPYRSSIARAKFIDASGSVRRYMEGSINSSSITRKSS